jgi:hypothetical protein
MIIIYGPEPPKINFTQSPNGDISFKVCNPNSIDIEPVPTTLRWRDLLGWRYFGVTKKSAEAAKNEFLEFTSELEKLTGSEAERAFFSKYVACCLDYFFEEGKEDNPWETAALIPQVWVNWIHYDSKDKLRAERIQKEPFRVDFMMKHEKLGSNPVVIEIDGLSHICDFKVGPTGSPIPSTSLDGFTLHTKKDRWLRKQGWQVFRMTNQEVEVGIDKFREFFFEVVGFFPDWADAPF